MINESSNSKGSIVGIVIISPEGIIAKHVLRFEFLATNNKAKYETIIAGLKIVKELGAQDLEVYGDFQLIVGQVNVDCEA